jgi:hypothetical protein
MALMNLCRDLSLVALTKTAKILIEIRIIWVTLVACPMLTNNALLRVTKSLLTGVRP